MRPESLPYRLGGDPLPTQEDTIQDTGVLGHRVEERLIDVGLGFPPIIQAVAIRVTKDERLAESCFKGGGVGGRFQRIQQGIFEKENGAIWVALRQRKEIVLKDLRIAGYGNA